jgi:hypothetical protein
VSSIAVRRVLPVLFAALALIGCGGTASDSESSTTAAAPTTTISTTIPPTTTTTSTSTTSSTTTTSPTTTTAETIDPNAAQDEVAAAGDRWIAIHEVTLDQVQTLNDVNLEVAAGRDSVWLDIFGTDEGNVYALYTTLAICTWIEEETPPQDVLDTVVAATTALIDDQDEVLFFIGLAVSGAANVFCPELSDTVRQVVP